MLINEFKIGGNEVFVGWEEMESIEFGGDNGCCRRCLADQDVIKGRVFTSLGDPKTGSGIALRVGIHQKDGNIISREGGGEVDGGGGFSDPALLIGNGYGFSHAVYSLRAKRRPFKIAGFTWNIFLP